MESPICTVCTISGCSGLLIVQIWCIYRLCITIGTVKIHKNCLYGSVFSTDINKKIVFNFLLIFKLFLLVSKLYESSQ